MKGSDNQNAPARTIHDLGKKSREEIDKLNKDRKERKATQVAERKERLDLQSTERKRKHLENAQKNKEQEKVDREKKDDDSGIREWSEFKGCEGAITSLLEEDRVTKELHSARMEKLRVLFQAKETLRLQWAAAGNKVPTTTLW
ncbi:hypothetical protein PVAG01_08927 [Phlyctema vagabunda]|uniref:Uncharacterized protein n=1 Tax=Phlyctema vagabunda TaxID=108571 RepID=A0ABR4PAW6_9HELO